MKKYINRSVFATILCVGTGVGSYGQVQQDLEDVVVLSDKLQIPFKKQNRNIQILDAEQIAQIPANTVQELLAYITGVDVRQRGPNGSQADIGIDGGTFDQTLLLINGFKASDPQTGHNMLNIPIPVASIERIEVLKGGAARIYGVNALMGVINIVTKKQAENNFIAQLNGGSSFQKDDSTGNTYANFGAQVVGQMVTGSWKHLIAASWDQGNGYRYNTAFQNSKVLYTGQGQISKNAALELLAGTVNNSFGANAFYAAPGDKESKEEVSTSYLALRAPIQINKNWILRPSVNYRNGWDHYIFVRKNPAIFQNKHTTNTIDINLDNIINTNWGNLALGVNLRDEQISSSNLGKNARVNYGGFIEYQYPFWEKWDVNLGAYFNQNSVFGFNVYPGFDIGYQWMPSLRIYANAGAGQRLPTFTDLFYRGPNNIGNESLNPEFMYSYELGAKYNKHNLYANASVFYKNGRDFIDWTRPDTSSAWMVNNFATINTFGLHLDAAYHHSWNKNNLQLFTGYTYLNPKIGTTSDDEKQNWASQYAINALQHQWIIRAALQLKNGLQFSLANRMINRLNAGNPINGYARNSYQLTDASVAYVYNTLRFDITVNNVFDVKYIESGVVPLPGRWINVGLKYSLK